VARAAIARVVTVLAGAPGAAVYHCAAGKDRTGVVSAVLLGLLGVPDEVIVQDYVATRERLDAIVERLMATEGYRAMLAALPPDTLHAEPETMAAFLESVRARHGSMEGYARAAGVDQGTLDRLAVRLLEG
jgi:protein-tyrosine phosphatase